MGLVMLVGLLTLVGEWGGNGRPVWALSQQGVAGGEGGLRRNVDIGRRKARFQVYGEGRAIMVGRAKEVKEGGGGERRRNSVWNNVAKEAWQFVRRDYLDQKSLDEGLKGGCEALHCRIFDALQH